jgi:hypothetical protein
VIEGKKSGKRGLDAQSKVPGIVSGESRPKGWSHDALRKVASVTLSQVQSLLTHCIEANIPILLNGLFVYQSLSQSRNLYPLTYGSGQRAVEIFSDVHRVIARMKTWIWGTHSYLFENTLTASYRNFHIVLIGGFESAVSPSLTAWLELAVQWRQLGIAN